MPVCKKCFKPIKDNSLFNLLNNPHACTQCFQEIRPHFTHFKINEIDAYSIYDYNQQIQSLLYQLKGCYDIEISDLFLERYKRELFLFFLGYKMVPIPSYEPEDRKREFNHVIEIFKSLKLPMLKVLKKTKKYKQANNTKKQRSEIEKYLTFTGQKKDIYNQKILLIDDVYTTGSTMKAVIKIIKQFNPKTIKVLVMSKTVFKPDKLITI